MSELFQRVNVHPSDSVVTEIKIDQIGELVDPFDRLYLVLVTAKTVYIWN